MILPPFFLQKPICKQWVRPPLAQVQPFLFNKTWLWKMHDVIIKPIFTEGVKHTQILAETRSLKSQKSIDQDQPSPVERSVTTSIFAERYKIFLHCFKYRLHEYFCCMWLLFASRPSAGWTPEVIKIQNKSSQKRQLIDESAECKLFCPYKS